MIISESPHYKFANQTLEWLSMDTKERYQNNLNHHRDQLEKYNWIDLQFTYKFNSKGFRCSEFTNEPSIVFLGCSLTQGVGLPIEQTWATIVANQLNLKCYNLGIGGSSNDTAFRLAYSWLTTIKPIYVVLCTPHSERLELLSMDKCFQLLANPGTPRPGEDFYKHWICNENNSTLNKIKNIFAIKYLCSQLNIKLTVIDSNTLFLKMNEDLARDLAHPGINSNLKFAEYVLSELSLNI